MTKLQHKPEKLNEALKINVALNENEKHRACNAVLKAFHIPENKSLREKEKFFNFQPINI